VGELGLVVGLVGLVVVTLCFTCDAVSRLSIILRNS